MRRFLMLVCLLALLLPARTLAEEADTVYILVDDRGETITQYAGTPEAGDEYISHDNRHYVVRSVDEMTHTALAESLGSYAMPDVRWLQGESQAVSAGEGRAVALYCTHSDESYAPTDGKASVTPRGGIYDVAEALKANLESRGVTVYYDDSTHLPHDAGAYRRSRATAEELLKNRVDAIFDVHRDGIPDPKQYETTIDGQQASMVRLLVGRSNQNTESNKAFAAELKAVADTLYPELVRDIYIGKGTYNQDLSPHAVLLEFGTHTIDKDRAEQATRYMAETIQKTLYGGVSGAAAGDRAADTRRGAWTGVAWIVGLVLVGACGFALLSTGNLRQAAGKLGDGVREISGGLLNKKNKE